MDWPHFLPASLTQQPQKIDAGQQMTCKTGNELFLSTSTRNPVVEILTHSSDNGHGESTIDPLVPRTLEVLQFACIVGPTILQWQGF